MKFQLCITITLIDLCASHRTIASHVGFLGESHFLHPQKGPRGRPITCAKFCDFVEVYPRYFRTYHSQTRQVDWFWGAVSSSLNGWPVLKAEKHLINCYTTQSDAQLIFSRIIVFVIYSKDTQKELNCPMWGNPDSGLGKSSLVACKSLPLQFGILGFGIGNAAQRTRIPITITIRNPNSTEKESDKNLRFPFMGRKKGLQACPGKQHCLVWVRGENRA